MLQYSSKVTDRDGEDLEILAFLNGRRSVRYCSHEESDNHTVQQGTMLQVCYTLLEYFVSNTKYIPAGVYIYIIRHNTIYLFICKYEICELFAETEYPFGEGR